MIYLTTNSDGNHTEGIGAMAQYQLFCYALSKHLNVKFIFDGFKNLQHWQYCSKNQETFVKEVNTFFNLPCTESYFLKDINKITISSINHLEEILSLDKDVVIELCPKFLIDYGQSNIEIIEKNNWIKDLFSNIKPYKINTDSNDLTNFFNIDVHIRKYTKTDCDPSSIRDLYESSKEQYYCNIINNLIKIYSSKNIKIKIHSQGFESDFNIFNNYDNVHLCIEEHPLKSLYSMITSDVLVMANSSLSYIASLYRSKITYKKDTFYHNTYKNNVYLLSSIL